MTRAGSLFHGFIACIGNVTKDIYYPGIVPACRCKVSEDSGQKLINSLLSHDLIEMGTQRTHIDESSLY